MQSRQGTPPIEGFITASPFHSLLQAREPAGFPVKLTMATPRILDSSPASWYTGLVGPPSDAVLALAGRAGAHPVQCGIEKEEER